ncbi:hypothetical protein EK21DRAFT_98955 [Setomelanomma holmii]|uniref:Zn(2)-C6 fungal-type domain-containing protein n=1 Tax=Setomelanomma holmii TaxID=210430 RepID=A0A9P4HF99_9PLEO|nr:hypothetical protein EK21DRAFT_98955 [Setomelanomma holmii]
MVSPDARNSRTARSSAEDSLDTRPAKRNRITVACTWCRNRKSRCDGTRPKCSACIERRGDCVYSDIPTLTKKSASKESVNMLLEDLRFRLATLEGSVSRLDSRLTSVEGVKDMPCVVTEQLLQDQASYAPDHFHHSEDDLDITEGRNATDGMGSIIFAREEDSGYFGPSSNIAFTRKIIRITASILKSAAYGASPVPPSYDGVQSYILHRSRAVSPVADQSSNASSNFREVEAFALPPEGETLPLIDHYFRTTGVLFPYIDEVEFHKTYRQLASTNIRSVRRSWLGLLNMVLAMSVHVNFDSELAAPERAARSDVFFCRAMALCDKQIRHGTSLEVVQLLLLMSQYLQGTDRSIETWNIHGLAVKAAYQLGLHSPSALQLYQDPEREIRKRTWFGCVLLDRTLSMTFGRPPSIPEKYVKLDLPSPSAFTSHSSADFVPYSIGESSGSFYVATITLYTIMGEVVETLYGDNLGYDSPANVFDLASTVLQFEQKFLSWQQSLPADLSVIEAASIHPEMNDREQVRFQFVLTIRFLNVRILTHRPILCRYLDILGSAKPDNQEAITLRQVSASSLRTCVQSALEIINIMHRVLSPPEPPRPPSEVFLNVANAMIALNAALVIYSALLVEHQTSIHNQPAVFEKDDLSLDQLQQAIECLSLLFKGNRMTEKCVQYASHLAQLLSVICTLFNALYLRAMLTRRIRPTIGFAADRSVSTFVDQF